MAYSELVKNFDKIRAYMREFYVYGFKSRTEYDAKSARSYDDERRRIESWLGDYMRFTQTAEGKNVFLSVDNRVSQHNPFYKAWKAKSFTDRDITLHFIIFDILHDASVRMTLKEIIEVIDQDYLASFEEPMSLDESTVRKKLKEYIEEGLLLTEKEGRQVYYRRAEMTDLSSVQDALDYFSEAMPCGVVGSYLLDRLAADESIFSFKHHYITGTLDSDVMALLFDAMGKKSYVTVRNLNRRGNEPKELQLVPLKIYISTQNGRQYLLAYQEDFDRISSYRLDYLSAVRIGAVCQQFDALRAMLCELEKHMWGVNCRLHAKHLEHVEFVVRVGSDEAYIVQRLEREKRCGTVEQIDEEHYRFTAEVFDTMEMVPWIRTFISRITRFNFSNRTVENKVREDLEKMYRMYGIDGGDEA